MNSPQQLFRLHWKNHSPNFVTCFSQLLNSETLVDVTLAADGKQIQAHRVVLSACSTYFQELFVSHPCQHPIVILKDINFRDLCTVIQFMYYGEVNIQHDQLNSILKTAEVLRVKGFADVADKESFSSALLTQQQIQSTSPGRTLTPRQYPEQLYDSVDDQGTTSANNKRKRQRHGSTSSQTKSSQQLSLRRETFQISREGTGSSFRSSVGSFDSTSVIKSQSSFLGQSSMESIADNDGFRDETMPSNSPTGSGGDGHSVTGENGGAANTSTSSSSQSKQKRNRTLTRQERVTRKEGETAVDNERASPLIHSLQPILPKSPKSSGMEASDLRPRIQTTTYLQLPPTATTSTQLIRQRSQPSPSPSAGSLFNRTSPTPPPPQSLSFIAPNIPTLAVTPVSSAPNIVIEQFPTILRVVSIEEMNMATEFQASPIPTLARTPSQSGNTLQVPCITMDPVPESSSQHGPSRSKARTEDNLRRSVSNPGVSHSSPTSTPPGSNGHCPVLRTGAALGCNYCWNTNDSHGRILRRKTKYHCPDCQANLCIVPCFQAYHEKFVSQSSNEAKPSGPQHKNPAVSHQLLSKMSSI